jgi:hypothetical protein
VLAAILEADGLGEYQDAFGVTSRSFVSPSPGSLLVGQLHNQIFNQQLLK